MAEFQSVRAAITIVNMWHANHTYGNFPFICHLTDVAHHTQRFTDDSEVIAAAWMHDLVEDCDVTLGNMEMWGFSYMTRSIVDLLTDPEGANRKEKKANMYKRYVEGETNYIYQSARLVKCCDRLSNMRFSYQTGNMKKMQMYHDEFSVFMKNIAYMGSMRAIPEDLIQDLYNVYIQIVQKVLPIA